MKKCLEDNVNDKKRTNHFVRLLIKTPIEVRNFMLKTKKKIYISGSKKCS